VFGLPDFETFAGHLIASALGGAFASCFLSYVGGDLLGILFQGKSGEVDRTRRAWLGCAFVTVCAIGLLIAAMYSYEKATKAPWDRDYVEYVASKAFDKALNLCSFAAGMLAAGVGGVFPSGFGRHSDYRE